MSIVAGGGFSAVALSAQLRSQAKRPVSGGFRGSISDQLTTINGGSAAPSKGNLLALAPAHP
jgi:hypothetical protein